MVCGASHYESEETALNHPDDEPGRSLPEAGIADSTR